MIQAVGGKTTTGQNGGLAIPNGRTVVLFMSIVFDRGTSVPDKLAHGADYERSFRAWSGDRNASHLFACAGTPHWKGGIGSQPTARAMIPTIIIGAES